MILLSDVVFSVSESLSEVLSFFQIPLLLVCGFLVVSIGVIAVLELLRSFDRFPFLKGKNGKKGCKSNDGD